MEEREIGALRIVSPYLLWYKALLMREKAKVILRRADVYDPALVARIIDGYPFLFWTWFKRLITGRF